MNINERLKLLRQENNLTQKEVAIKCGIEETTIQRLEYGGKPSLDTIIKLANCFGVSIDYLLGRSDDPKIK